MGQSFSLCTQVRKRASKKSFITSSSCDIECEATNPLPFLLVAGATSVNWHQDNHFFGTSSSHITSCAVYLEPTNQANGCLKVIPRSHLSGILPHAPGSGIWANGEWATGVNEEEAVQVECEAGSVVLFNSLLLHAANVNETTDRTRFSLFSHFVPRGLDFSWREEDFSYGVFKDRYHYVE